MLSIVRPIRSRRRKGAVAMMVALLLVAILGLMALAFDTGWIMMTRTELQAVADSSSLAGGTELLPGLGKFATSTPAEVATAASAAAVDYAGRNPNAEIDSSYIDPERDIRFGKAVFDNDCGCWSKTENAEPYNYVEVTARRDQSGNGQDQPVPLFFARIFNYDTIGLAGTATAVILPANGFRIAPGSNDRANIMPFAFRRDLWDRFKRAQEHYDDNPGVFDDPEALKEILDPEATDSVDNRLFGVRELRPNGTYQFKQLFYDRYTVNSGNVSSSGNPDGILEVDIYPHGIAEGNFGTIDLGSGNNSTSDLMRQIVEGMNESDLSYFDNNEITLSEEDPLDMEADTGISGGIESSLNSVIGQCKAIALFSEVDEGTGNNTVYTLVKFVAVTIVEVELGGSVTDKILLMQECTLVDDTAVGDIDEEIGEETTIFTPLILIE